MWGTVSILTRTVDRNGGNHEIARQGLISADKSNSCTLETKLVTWASVEYELYLL